MLIRIRPNKEDSRDHWNIPSRLSNSYSHSAGMDMKQISQGRISDNLYDLGMVWNSLVVFEATQENGGRKSIPKGKRSMPKGPLKREEARNITSMGRRNQGKP